MSESWSWAGVSGSGGSRPSSGLWTVLGWLRAARSSSGSESSGGSARTAASFAFVPPRAYRAATAEPRARRSPPASPTPSYRRRLRERDERRLRDADLTLAAKYRLPGCHEASTLPAPRTARDPLRRAASERTERRAAHVPGKRRAPPPPAASRSLPRRRAKKRPAPPPPPPHANTLPCRDKHTRTPLDYKTNELDIVMNAHRRSNEAAAPADQLQPGHQTEKFCRKENSDVKLRPERNFLKQIFESKKRNSTAETALKLLPNISELDREATELLNSYRLKTMERNDDLTDGNERKSFKSDMWICTRCLRKYDGSVVTCLYCIFVEKLPNASESRKAFKDSSVQANCSKNMNGKFNGTRSNDAEEKQKLKEMLKDMKNSLPKRTKVKQNFYEDIKTDDDNSIRASMETPTLPMGSSFNNTNNVSARGLEDKSVKLVPISSDSNGANQTVTITQTTVLIDYRSQEKNSENGEPPTNVKGLQSNSQLQPLKISSLFNPVYVPKSPASTRSIFLSTNKSHNKDASTSKELTSTRSPILDQRIIRNNIQLNQVNPNSVSLTDTENKKLELSGPAPSINQVKLDLVSKQKSCVENNKDSINLEKLTKTPEPSKNCDESKIAAFVVSSSPTKNILSRQPQVEAEKYRENNMKPKHKIDTKMEAKKALAIETQALENEISKHLQKASATTSLHQPSTSNVSQTQAGGSTPESKPSTSQINNSGDRASIMSLDLLSKRRYLIHQLEQSIASGNEEAAAEAAVKLAQLRLSCSVLSFSSQIATGTPQAPAAPKAINADLKKEAKVVQNKIDTTTQSVATTANTNIQNPIHSNIKSNANAVVTRTKSKEPSNAKQDINKIENNLQKSEASQPSTSRTELHDDVVSVRVWVEDAEACRGPVRVRVRRGATLSELRGAAHRSLALPPPLQRWIIGTTLCCDDETPLARLAGPALDVPFYLCLVQSDKNTSPDRNTSTIIEEAVTQTPTTMNENTVYEELMQLERGEVVPNAEEFECGVCLEACGAGGGVVLRECAHAFCRACAAHAARLSADAALACLAHACAGHFQEREVRGILSAEEFERYLARGLAAAEGASRNAFHCRTPDCSGWALCEFGVTKFPCPVCKKTNCVPCQAIHESENCDQYRTRQRQAAAEQSVQTQSDDSTRTLLEELISRGEALSCPECDAIITKKWGCDWIRCAACKTEICWVTRGRRWGPAGRGDTSAGCRCGLDGKRCHPACSYCH